MSHVESRLALAAGLTAALLAGCTSTGDVSHLPDSDGDGLVDVFEEHIGTDPAAPDSDGDGYDDLDEYSRYFDATDENDFPYIGGYPRQPLPSGGVDGTGWYEGDVSLSWSRPDQYGQTLDLEKFYGNVVLITNGLMVDTVPTENSGFG